MLFDCWSYEGILFAKKAKDARTTMVQTLKKLEKAIGTSVENLSLNGMRLRTRKDKNLGASLSNQATNDISALWEGG